MDADDAQAECSCIINSTSPSGKAAYFRPFHQVTGLMLLISHVWVQVETICGVTVASLSGLSYFILFRHTLFSWVHGNHAYHTIRHVLLTCQFEGFKIPHCFLFKCCSFAIILFLIIYKKNSKKTGRDRFLPKHWKKWKKHISSRTEETGFFHGRNRPSEETANPAMCAWLACALSRQQWTLMEGSYTER